MLTHFIWSQLFFFLVICGGICKSHDGDAKSSSYKKISMQDHCSKNKFARVDIGNEPALIHFESSAPHLFPWQKCTLRIETLPALGLAAFVEDL
jgi:hypothetical protein